MEVNKRLLAFFAEEEVTVLVVVHEEVFASAGGVAVDGDEDDVLAAQLPAPVVVAAASPGQGDVRFLRHQERSVQAPGGEGVYNAQGDDAVFEVFQQAAIGRTLALRLGSVAIVDEDLHSCFCA